MFFRKQRNAARMNASRTREAKSDRRIDELDGRGVEKEGKEKDETDIGIGAAGR